MVSKMLIHNFSECYNLLNRCNLTRISPFKEFISIVDDYKTHCMCTNPNQKESKKNKNMSFTEFTTQSPVGEGPIDPSKAKVGAIPTVTSQEQYDALKSGTEYIEDGKKFRKP